MSECGSVKGAYNPRVSLVYSDNTREDFTLDGSNNLMWRYETADGPRWIGWRALAEKVEWFLEVHA